VRGTRQPQSSPTLPPPHRRARTTQTRAGPAAAALIGNAAGTGTAAAGRRSSRSWPRAGWRRSANPLASAASAIRNELAEFAQLAQRLCGYCLRPGACGYAHDPRIWIARFLRGSSSVDGERLGDRGAAARRERNCAGASLAREVRSSRAHGGRRGAGGAGPPRRTATTVPSDVGSGTPGGSAPPVALSAAGELLPVVGVVFTRRCPAPSRHGPAAGGCGATAGARLEVASRDFRGRHPRGASRFISSGAFLARIGCAGEWLRLSLGRTRSSACR